MGFYDRDYYREERGGFMSRLPIWSVTTWLIAINVAVFVIDSLLRRFGIGYILEVTGPDFGTVRLPFSPLEFWGHFSGVMAIQHLQLWRFITFQFLHANVMHLLFNMLGLYFFGQMVESYLGPRRYLAFYLLCGIAGAVCYLGLWAMHILISAPWMPLIGASAGIFGVLVAGAYIAPNVEVMLLFPPIPMRLKTLAWALLAVAVFTVFMNGSNAGGEAAHLGGAVLGLVLIRNPHWLNVFTFSLPRRPNTRSRAFWNRNEYR